MCICCRRGDIPAGPDAKVDASISDKSCPDKMMVGLAGKRQLSRKVAASSGLCAGGTDKLYSTLFGIPGPSTVLSVMSTNRLWVTLSFFFLLVVLLYPDVRLNRAVGRTHLLTFNDRPKKSAVRRGDLQGAFALAGGVPA
jgi:hypothetical protein